MRHPNLNIFTLFAVITIAMSNLFLYCYFGKSATDVYFKIGDRLYELDWTQLPIDLQKSLIIIIANCQIPLYYHGFGVVYLNLITFTKVCFLILKIF